MAEYLGQDPLGDNLKPQDFDERVSKKSFTETGDLLDIAIEIFELDQRTIEVPFEICARLIKDHSIELRKG